ncbi:hypothetical protein [Mucilaginibacter sp. NFX135]
MKFIKRRTHAMLDYLVGIIMIASPWLLGFATVFISKAVFTKWW